MNINAIIEFLDNYLVKNNLGSLTAVEANALLEKTGLLSDSKSRPGKPFRELLRKGLIPHAYQKGSRNWIIPRLQGRTNLEAPPHKEFRDNQSTTPIGQEECQRLRLRLEEAREAYKPDQIKYLLVAEAPPNATDRFFYFHDVKSADFLFLGVMECLYPDLKDAYLESRRSDILKQRMLQKFQKDGFYLIDLCELPISVDPISQRHISQLVPRIQKLVNKETRIILIKATVYERCYSILAKVFGKRVSDNRMPFPSTGNQKAFRQAFSAAIRQAQRG